MIINSFGNGNSHGTGYGRGGGWGNLSYSLGGMNDDGNDFGNCKSCGYGNGSGCGCNDGWGNGSGDGSGYSYGSFISTFLIDG